MSQSHPSSHAQSQANAKVDSSKGQPSQDEDGFIDIHHDDVEMPDSETKDATDPSPAPLELQRYSNNLEDPDVAVDNEDDSEDDHDPMAHHPLLSMLTGRLGQRRRGSTHVWDRLHPENQALSVANVDECFSLETEAFPPEERASREKVGLCRAADC